MIKVENIEVFNFEGAFRGMRNPMNSWDKSDSEYKYWCNCLNSNEKPHYCENCNYDACNPDFSRSNEIFVIGPNDLKLAQNLILSGTDHSKFMRQIFVTIDVIAPLYWWKEFDTYKIGTVANSCSTMHKITEKEFVLDDFSHEHLFTDDEAIVFFEHLIAGLNFYRAKYIQTKNKDYWWQIIQLLPSSYNQKRTITLNYQVLRTIYFARKNHKLDEWKDFCLMIERLPYARELICLEKRESNE